MKKYFLASICFLLLAIVSCNHTTTKDSSKLQGADSVLVQLNENIAKNPADAALLVKRADYYLSVERMNDALKDVNDALKLDPVNKEGNLLLSSIDILDGKPQQALEILNKVIAHDPDYKQAYLKKAKLCLIMKDYENCAQAVQKVFQLDPHNADAYYLKGVALDENKEAAKALEAFQKAVLYDPRHYDALMQLGYANSKSNPKMAIDYFNNALKVIPTSNEALYNVGMLYQENDQPKKALDIYAQMLKVNPNNKLALYNSGYVNMVYLSKLKESYDFFTRAITIDSLFTDAYYNRAYCSELKGDFKLAREDYNKVLKLRVNDEKAISGLNRLDKHRSK
ncbi:MAG: tetratricopeptide repeat protein [Bacteroidetes bacterium]|nr:tetratricopeptide repeat protein [Bacteroidota bacterium]